MPGATMAKLKGFCYGLSPFLWGLWLVLVIWVCYQTRFWINNDTLGSLDVARSLRQMDWRQAVNLHWGMVYAILLAFLPLGDASSWMQIHFLNGILLVGSQLFLYLSLSLLGVRKSINTMLCLAWGAANFATGGAIFITSDVTLCFVGSLYIYALVRARTLERITRCRCALLLGLLHGLAWMTKNIAFIGLASVPLMVSLKLILDSYGKLFLEKERLYRILTFLVSYSLPILLVMVVWGAGIKSKYGRFSWGDSGAYNYAYFVRHSPELHRSIEAARLRLPPYGTYWWSDISLSLTGWDHQSHFNLTDQIRTVFHNLKHFFSSLEIAQGAGILCLLVLGLAGAPVVALRKTDYFFLILLLSSVFFFIFLMYLAVLFSSKYLPFPVMFLLPAGGLLAENIFQTNNRPLKVLISIMLAFCVLHGSGAMVYASLRLAPEGEHFAIAKFIRDSRGSNKNPGPIGAFLYPQANLFHHVVIAHLLNTKTAELHKINDNFSFSASFIPKIVLLVLAPDGAVPNSVEVNGKHFVRANSWVWGKLYKKNKLILYNPGEKLRK